MYKGEWQSVLSNRAFLDVNVGRFTLAWPMVPAVDPRGAAANIPAIYRSVPGQQTGSGWNAFTSTALEAAGEGADDVLPAGARPAATTSSSASRTSTTTTASASTDSQDRIGCRTQRRRRHRPIASASSTPARRATTAAAGRRRANIDQHYAGYMQDRWAPNNRLSISLGVRFDYQRVGYTDGCASREITDSTLGVQSVVCAGQAALCDGGAIFPTIDTGRRQARSSRTRTSRRASASATTSTGLARPC